MSLRPEQAPDFTKQLQHLADLSAADDINTVELPTVRVLLASGASVSGKVFALSPGNHVVLGVDPEESLTTLSIATIEAIEVPTTAHTAELFGLGKTSGRSASSHTQLDLKRRVKALGDKVSGRLDGKLSVSVPWDDVPNSDPARADMVAMLDDLDSALDSLSGDDMGREALSPIKTISFQKASQVGVAKDGKALLVSFRSQADRLRGPDQLLPAIEGVL